MEMETNLMKGYTDALNLAFAELAAKKPADVCLNAAAAYHADADAYRIAYLGKEYLVKPKRSELTEAASGQEVSATVKILLLHYLVHAGNSPLTGTPVSFRELTNGASIYYPTFCKRAVAPLIRHFGDNPDDLYRASEKLGGTREEFGHASVTIRVLPMVPVTYVVWQGEEDVPSSGTILFDSSVEQFLPAEDIVVAGSFGAYELIRLKKEQVN